jgi:hypothetical protein
MKIDDIIEIKATATFKYLGSIFTYLGKCKGEVLN